MWQSRDGREATYHPDADGRGKDEDRERRTEGKGLPSFIFSPNQNRWNALMHSSFARNGRGEDGRCLQICSDMLKKSKARLRDITSWLPLLVEAS